MSTLHETAPAFIEMAHRIVWATVATVDVDGRPRSRVLHPIWEWDGESVVGWIGTGPTPLKVSALGDTPFASVNYWDHQHDVATAECRATWAHDLETRRRIWKLYVDTPEPLGYDPSIIPSWDGPDSPSFSVLRLDPYRLRAFPGSMLLQGQGTIHHWRGDD